MGSIYSLLNGVIFRFLRDDLPYRIEILWNLDWSNLMQIILDIFLQSIKLNWSVRLMLEILDFHEPRAEGLICF